MRFGYSVHLLVKENRFETIPELFRQFKTKEIELDLLAQSQELKIGGSSFLVLTGPSQVKMLTTF